MRRTKLIGSALLSAAAVTLGACGCGGSSPAKPAASPSPTTTSPSATPTKTHQAARPAKCPLTGVRAPSATIAGRPALSVKIDNVGDALPQTGLDHADIVVEALVEGGLTRLFATFQCDGAKIVGPIRSARPVDADLLSLYRGSVFAYSGADPREIAPVRAHGNAVLLSNDDMGRPFYRVSFKSAPHNVYASTKDLLAAGIARRHDLKAPPQIFTYGPLKKRTLRAKNVWMSWPAASAAWTWSGGRWIRTQNGAPDVLTDGKRIGAANVIVMAINVGHTGIFDDAGNEDPYDFVLGKNPVWVFRNGHEIIGHWTRQATGKKLKLIDRTGHLIRLQRGRTWIELLPVPRQPTVAR